MIVESSAHVFVTSFCQCWNVETRLCFWGEQWCAVFRITWWQNLCRSATLLHLLNWIGGFRVPTTRELVVFLQVNMWRRPEYQVHEVEFCVHEDASSPRCCLHRRPRVIHMAFVVLQRRRLFHTFLPPTYLALTSNGLQNRTYQRWKSRIRRHCHCVSTSQKYS